MSCLEKKDRKQKKFKVSKSTEKKVRKTLSPQKKQTKQKNKTKNKKKIWRLVHLMN